MDILIDDAMLEQNPIVVYEFDLTGQILYTKGSGLKNIGSYPDKSAGQNIVQLFDNNPMVAQMVARAIEGELVFYKAKLAGRWFNTWYIPLFNRVLGVSLDVTRREVSKRRMRTAMDIFLKGESDG